MAARPAAQQRIQLRDFVDDVLGALQHQARWRHVTLSGLVFAPAMEADPSALRSLLSALVDAALKRAPAGTNVTVVVSPRGESVEFLIADEGPGLALDSSSSPAEPLGSTRQRAAKEAGGLLSVRENDAGTVVSLNVPSTLRGTPAGPPHPRMVEFGDRPPASTPLAQPRAQSGIYTRSTAEHLVKGARSVLVVDDEPLIRHVIVKLLETAGYPSLTAASAEEALEKLHEHEEIALLLSDVGLPGLSGPELVRRTRLLYPRLPSLLMSATPKEALLEAFVLEPDTFLLPKPFEASALLAKLSELLPSTSREAALQRASS